MQYNRNLNIRSYQPINSLRPEYLYHIRVEVIHNTHQCFELLGIDIVIDEDLRPYVVEVNVSPGMQGEDSELDKIMKNEVLLDTYNMARIIDCNPQERSPCREAQLIYDYERRSISNDRRQKVENGLIDPWENPVFADVQIVREYLDEQKRMRYYHIAFPTPENVDYYEQCFSRFQYEDVVLKKWIQMSDSRKYEVLSKALETFDEELQQALSYQSWCSIA